MNHALSEQTTSSSLGACLYMPVASKTCYRMVDEQDQQPLQAISPVQAYADFQRIMNMGKVSMTGVCGPGDALADAPNTLAYLHMVRDGHPEVGLCLTTIGLGGQEWAEELGQLRMNQITVLIDTVSAAVADKLFSWIRPGKKTLPRQAAMELLISKQAEAVRAFKSIGAEVNILTTVRPGVNDHEVGIISRQMAELGASAMNVRLAPDENADGPLLDRLQAEAGEFLPLFDWTDSMGLRSEAVCPGAGIGGRPVPTGARPFVAVTSSDASMVDMHLGQAPQFLIYGPKDGAVSLLGTRPAPAPGSGAARWDGVAEILSDCAYLVVASAGSKPREVLESKGLAVIVAEGGVDGLVDGLYGGGKKPRKK